MVRRTLFAGISAFCAAALAACGGGGPGTADATPTPPSPSFAVQAGDTLHTGMAGSIVNPDGTVVSVGSFDGSATFGVLEPGEQTLVMGGGGYDAYVSCHGLDGSLQWVRHLSGTSWTILEGIARDPQNGDFVVCGYFWGSVIFGDGEPNQTTLSVDVEPSFEDAFVARFAPDGTLRWAKEINGAGTQECLGVHVLPNGVTVVAGVFVGSAILGEGENGQTTLVGGAGFADAFGAAFAVDGTFLGASGTESDASSWASSGQIHGYADGSYAVGGDFSGTVTFGAGEAEETTLAAGNPNTNVFLARYAADDSLSWVHRLGGDTGDQAMTLGGDASGAAVIGGVFKGNAAFEGTSGDILEASTGEQDGFVARYSATGNVEWVSSITGPLTAAVTSLEVLADSSVVATGYYVDMATFGAGEPGETIVMTQDPLDFDVFVARFLPDGTLASAGGYGSTGQDSGTQICVYPDGGLFVGGSFSGTAVFDDLQAPVTAFGDADAFFVRIQP